MRNFPNNVKITKKSSMTLNLNCLRGLNPNSMPKLLPKQLLMHFLNTKTPSQPKNKPWRHLTLTNWMNSLQVCHRWRGRLTIWKLSTTKQTKRCKTGSRRWWKSRMLSSSSITITRSKINATIILLKIWGHINYPKIKIILLVTCSWMIYVGIS